MVCLEWPTSVYFGQAFAHRFSCQGDLIGIVHEPVKDGIGQRWLHKWGQILSCASYDMECICVLGPAISRNVAGTEILMMFALGSFHAWLSP